MENISLLGMQFAKCICRFAGLFVDLFNFIMYTIVSKKKMNSLRLIIHHATTPRT